MRAYVVVTGVLFALVAVAHLARTGEILTHVADDLWFVVVYEALTLMAIGVAAWAWWVYRRLPGGGARRS